MIILSSCRVRYTPLSSEHQKPLPPGPLNSPFQPPWMMKEVLTLCYVAVGRWRRLFCHAPLSIAPIVKGGAAFGFYRAGTTYKHEANILSRRLYMVHRHFISVCYVSATKRIGIKHIAA
jgi:hypothetical protein